MTDSAFDYHLPDELIADYPTQRGSSKMLVFNENTISDNYVSNFTQFLTKKDLVIFNNSKVIKARIYAHKISGGKIEILVERVLSENNLLVHLRSNSKIVLDSLIYLPNNLIMRIVNKDNGLFTLQPESDLDATFNMYDYMDEVGQIPLPKYIKRAAQNSDLDRYQTVYAKHIGSVAAPTAGLHFTQQIMQDISNVANVEYVTLHVGAGTFKPIVVEDITQHKMHSEYFQISGIVIQKIRDTIAVGGRIIAVGTTSARVIESVYSVISNITPAESYSGETDLFIYPGYRFKLVDSLFTNFHLPKSTLLLLVSAFIGKDNITRIYQHAIDKRYKFYSYGDAMFITKRVNCG